MEVTLTEKQIRAIVDRYLGRVSSEEEQKRLALLLFLRCDSLDPIPALIAAVQQVDEQHCLPLDKAVKELKKWL